jgi:hypothetical protein
MRTYQLRSRNVKLTGKNKNITFPNLVELEIYLESNTIFGLESEHTNTTLFDPKHITQKMNFEDQTGTYSILPDPQFLPVDIDLNILDIQVEMHGNKVHAKSKCANENELFNFIFTFQYILPTLLTIELVEAPVVKSIKGKIGDVPFEWALRQISFDFSNTNKEKQELRISDSFKRTSLICDPANKRLEAALFYFYISKRLMKAGASPFEFLSETILNYSKVLEILFAHSKDSMDDARKELLNFNYNEQEIELKFIPIMALRSHFDVGHATTNTLKQEHLDVIHEFLINSESDIRTLLKRIIIKIQDGSYKFHKKFYNSKSARDKQIALNKMISTCKQRNKEEAAKRHLLLNKDSMQIYLKIIE